MTRPITLAALALALTGCSAFGPAPAMSVAVECQLGDTVFQIEAGHWLLDPEKTTPGLKGAAPEHVCREIVELWLQPYREEYEARFGHVSLTEHPVRLRSAQDLRQSPGFPDHVDFSVGGHTYADAIDLAGGNFGSLPHEMNHVRAGAGHAGWCDDFEPWIESVLGMNQREYLGCH